MTETAEGNTRVRIVVEACLEYMRNGFLTVSITGAILTPASPQFASSVDSPLKTCIRELESRDGAFQIYHGMGRLPRNDAGGQGIQEDDHGFSRRRVSETTVRPFGKNATFLEKVGRAEGSRPIVGKVWLVNLRSLRKNRHSMVHRKITRRY